jgi:hypothetical protein
LMM